MKSLSPASLILSQSLSLASLLSQAIHIFTVSWLVLSVFLFYILSISKVSILIASTHVANISSLPPLSCVPDSYSHLLSRCHHAMPPRHLKLIIRYLTSSYHFPRPIILSSINPTLIGYKFHALFIFPVHCQ